MQKWEYTTADIYYEEKCKLCLDEHKKPIAHWVFDIHDGNHYWINNGLNVLGAQGWELVGIQIASIIASALYYHPPHFYIFKRLIAN